MPYYRKKRTWKRKRYAKRSTKYARRKTTKRRKTAVRRKVGRASTRGTIVPRIRLRTMRQKVRTIKLRQDFEWTLAPDWTQVADECLFLEFRANSVLNIISQTGSAASGGVPNNVWRANDVSYQAVGGQQQFPDGFVLYQGEYYHFCVIASKISAVINQTDGTDLHYHDPGQPPPLPGSQTYQPTMAFLTKYGTQTNKPITATTNKQQLTNLPYTVLAEVHPANNNSGTVSGARLSMGYSAKRFEGCPSPLSASQLRGQVINAGTNAQPINHPNEQTFFALGICPQRGSAASTDDFMQPCQVQVKIEYMVVLTEPRPSQNAGIPPGPGLAGGAAAAAAAMGTGGDF